MLLVQQSIDALQYEVTPTMVSPALASLSGQATQVHASLPSGAICIAEAALEVLHHLAMLGTADLSHGFRRISSWAMSIFRYIQLWWCGLQTLQALHSLLS